MDGKALAILDLYSSHISVRYVAICLKQNVGPLEPISKWYSPQSFSICDSILPARFFENSDGTLTARRTRRSTPIRYFLFLRFECVRFVFSLCSELSVSVTQYFGVFEMARHNAFGGHNYRPPSTKVKRTCSRLDLGGCTA